MAEVEAKTQEGMEFRRRVNELMEHKRRLEEALEGFEFEMESMRDRY